LDFEGVKKAGLMWPAFDGKQKYLNHQTFFASIHGAVAPPATRLQLFSQSIEIKTPIFPIFSLC
jgi:hypothetical protein